MLRHSAARFTSSSLRETTTKRREDDEDGGEDDGNESSDNKPSGGLLSDEKGKCASRSLDVTRPPRVRDAQIYLRGRAGLDCSIGNGPEPSGLALWWKLIRVSY